MITDELLNFIKKSREMGKSDQEIQKSLLGAGWQNSDINAAFQRINISAQTEPKMPKFPANNNGANINEELKSGGPIPGSIDLIKESFNIFKSRWRTLIGIYLIPIIFLIVAGSILLIFIFTIGVSGLLFSGSAPEIMESLGMAGVVTAGLIIFFTIFGWFFVITWEMLALTYAISNWDKKIGIIGCYKQTIKKLLSGIWLYILSGIIILGGFCLFIIFGYVFMFWFSLAIFILVVENTKGMSALLKSKEYIKGYGWVVFGRYIMLSLIFAGFYLVPSVVVSIFALVFKESSSWLNNILNIFAFLASAAIMPFSMIYLYLIYSHLYKIKGGLPNFTAKTKNKNVFIIIGILGPILLIGGIFLAIYFFVQSLNNFIF